MTPAIDFRSTAACHAGGSSQHHTPTRAPVAKGDLVATWVVEAAVSAGTKDIIAAMRSDPLLLAAVEKHFSEFNRQGRVWTAYADGALAAAPGGRGVSTPPSQVLAAARTTPHLADTAASRAPRAAALVTQSGLVR